MTSQFRRYLGGFWMEGVPIVRAGMATSQFQRWLTDNKGAWLEGRPVTTPTGHLTPEFRRYLG